MSRRRSSVCAASLEAVPSVSESRRSTCGLSGIGIGVETCGAPGLAYLSVRSSGIIIEISEAAAALCGYESPADIVGRHVSVLWPSLEGASHVDRAVLEGPDGFQWTRRKDGSRVCTCVAESFDLGRPPTPASLDGDADLNAEGGSQSHGGDVVPAGESVLTLVLVDGTEMERVRSSNPFVDANFAVLQINKWGKIELVPPCSGGLLGMRPEAMIGRSIMEFIPEEDLPFFCRQMDSIFHCGSGTLHLTMIRKASLAADTPESPADGCATPRRELVDVEMWARVKDDTIICLVSEGPGRDAFLSRVPRDYDDVQRQVQRLAVAVWETAHASRLFRILEAIKALLLRTAVRGFATVVWAAESTLSIAAAVTPQALIEHVPVVKQIAYYIPLSHTLFGTSAPLLLTGPDSPPRKNSKDE